MYTFIRDGKYFIVYHKFEETQFFIERKSDNKMEIYNGTSLQSDECIRLSDKDKTIMNNWGWGVDIAKAWFEWVDELEKLKSQLRLSV